MVVAAEGAVVVLVAILDLAVEPPVLLHVAWEIFSQTSANEDFARHSLIAA